MERVSTNFTLFYKFFIPTFWIVFFGALTAGLLMADFNYVGNIPARTFRIGLLAFYLSGVAIMALTLMRLKRVEMDEDFIYVTNYFKNFRYPYHNIEKMEISRFLLLRTATIYFKTPGHFGKHVTFIANAGRLRDFLDTHPRVKQELPIAGKGW